MNDTLGKALEKFGRNDNKPRDDDLEKALEKFMREQKKENG
jgi:hypothetical protein